MTAMLRDGALDAAIFGNDLPAGDDLRPVFPDVAAAGRDFQARHGFVPVNHLVVVTAEVARDASVLAELLRMFGTATTTHDALAPAIDLASRWCAAQGLIPRPLTLEEAWT
jgi:4,5-dihydroxyphthalate decarboxylase